jgi:Ca2+-binding RTX toxin-like protein
MIGEFLVPNLNLVAQGDIYSAFSLLGSVVSATESTIIISGYDQKTAIYHGNFTYSPMPIYARGTVVAGSMIGAHGTISSFENYTGSTLTSFGDGFSIDASKAETSIVYEDRFTLSSLSTGALSGNDRISGSSGTDNLRGLGGDDSIFGGGGDDVIDGDYGKNIAVYSVRVLSELRTRLSDGMVRIC